MAIDVILINQLNMLIAEKKRNPDALIWGEVFYIIHLCKRSGGTIYKLNPIGELSYDEVTRRFIIRLPDIQLHLKDYELVDAIVYQDLFPPHLGYE